MADSLEGQDFDTLPTYEGQDFDNVPTKQAPAQSLAGQDFDTLPTYEGHDFDSLPTAGPQAEGPIKTFGRAAVHSVLPGIAGVAAAGAVTGALEGSVVPGWGTVAGAIVGGAAAAYGASKLQDAGMKELGVDDSTQLAANAEARPYASFGG